LQKDYVLTKEAVYIAFSFAMSNPKFAYETQNAWVDPARDELSGGSREWYAVNHWAAVRDGDGNSTAAIIPHDTPLVNFGDIVRGNWPTEFAPKSSTIFSWLMNNYWGTNFAPGQGGDFTFHYSIVSDRTFNPATLARTGWENMTPLESDAVNASFESGALPSNQAALLSVDNSDVAVVTWKIAEDGRGTILRLEELAGNAAKTKLTSQYFDVREAWRCSGLEDNQTRLASAASGVEIEIKPFEVVTLRLITGPRSHSADNTGKIAH
jgi:alpha-mannosidase